MSHFGIKCYVKQIFLKRVNAFGTMDFCTEQNDSDEDDDNTGNVAASAAIHRDNEVYSFVTALDDECEYATPRSNAPINRPSIVPSDRVLYQVIVPSLFPSSFDILTVLCLCNNSLGHVYLVHVVHLIYLAT